MVAFPVYVCCFNYPCLRFLIMMSNLSVYSVSCVGCVHCGRLVCRLRSFADGSLLHSRCWRSRFTSSQSLLQSDGPESKLRRCHNQCGERSWRIYWISRAIYHRRSNTKCTFHRAVCFIHMTDLYKIAIAGTTE